MYTFIEQIWLLKCKEPAIVSEDIRFANTLTAARQLAALLLIYLKCGWSDIVLSSVTSRRFHASRKSERKLSQMLDYIEEIC